MGDTVIVGTEGTELIPALLSSVDPNGTLARPVCSGDTVGVETAALSVPAQVPDAAPVVPPPSNSAVEGCEIELAALEHVALPGMRPDVDGDAAGLVPGANISVAPIAIPVGWTVEPGCRPSGEVAPMPGDELPSPLSCAKAGLQPMTAVISATIKTINMRLMAFFVG